MPTVEEGLRAQIRNIEAAYGRPIESWIELIRASGLTKHNEVVAMLKTEHGMTHGAAHRVSLVARQAGSDSPPPTRWTASSSPGSRRRAAAPAKAP